MLNINAQFGTQTVTFVTVTESGDPGYLGMKTETRTETPVEGCRFRPLNADETPDGTTDISTGMWKCTAPPEAAVLAAESTGELKVDGVTYQIEGPVMPKPDMAGNLHHVTILCKKQDG